MGLGDDHHCVVARNRSDSDVSQYVRRNPTHVLSVRAECMWVVDDRPRQLWVVVDQEPERQVPAVPRRRRCEETEEYVDRDWERPASGWMEHRGCSRRTEGHVQVGYCYCHRPLHELS